MSKPIPLFQVDAFTDVPFRGNPAAVCLLEAARDPAWMQAVAAEMNLAETAFLWPERDALRLRWFTPAVEVPLCGHATLASAHALYETGRVPSDAPIAFDTLSGRLAAVGEADGWIRLDFPALPPRAEPGEPPPGLLPALGLGAGAGASVYEVPRPNASDGPSWLVELASVAALRALAPDFRALRAVAGHAVIVTARGDGAHDFVSRFFAPKAGVDEDPVTGSAHCSLAPFWCARLARDELTGLQLSQRTGVVRVRRRGERVHLLGRAVTVLRGELAARD
jgi:PhzF family phenazine biosynthesis protein